jgi:hypothetical protein
MMVVVMLILLYIIMALFIVHRDISLALIMMIIPLETYLA